MRILKPETAKEREDKILRWIVQEFAQTKRPVSSDMIAKKAKMGVSSATVRNIMKKLEDEGLLHQEHTSGGRVPTDKAYRAYVDYLAGMQAVALKEKESIQREYDSRMDEMDTLLAQTSRMLASLSHSAGFAFSSPVAEQNVVRLDFIPLGPGAILAVMVTDSGNVRHLPVKLNYEIHPRRLRLLAAFLNQEVSGLPLREAKRRLWQHLNEDSSELRDVADLARRFLEDVEQRSAQESEFYLEGMGQLDFSGMTGAIGLMEERRRLAGLMEEKMRSLSSGERHVDIAIGAENELKELRGFSMITCPYRAGERVMGMVGIIGPKYMEYPRMISLVNFIGEVVETTISHWEDMLAPESKIIPLEYDEPRKRSRK
ncbi:MAG: heat-inducible transcriptional repressor HrcA [Elusimicrobiales bacterium]